MSRHIPAGRVSCFHKIGAIRITSSESAYNAVPLNISGGGSSAVPQPSKYLVANSAKPDVQGIGRSTSVLFRKLGTSTQAWVRSEFRDPCASVLK
jgi:hypothetical protein